MNVMKLPLSSLQRPERNVRMHTGKQLREFERSVTMFGQIRPIVVDENRVILAGNGLYETLLRMGREEADVLLMEGLTENQASFLMLCFLPSFMLPPPSWRTGGPRPRLKERSASFQRSYMQPG